MRKQLSILLTTLIIIMSIFNVSIGNSYAISSTNELVNDLLNKEGYSYLGKKTDIPLDKVFEINFSRDVNFNTVSGNIRLFRENSTSGISLDVTKGISSKIIKVSAKDTLVHNSRYYLVADNDIEDTDGKELLSGVVLEFETVDLQNSGFNVTNINYIKKDTIEIIFNEDVDQITALNQENYYINGKNLKELNAQLSMSEGGKVYIKLPKEVDLELRMDKYIRVSNKVKSKYGELMEYDYTKNIILNTLNNFDGEYLIDGSANYNRLEVNSTVNVFGKSIQIRNANIDGDLYLCGGYNEIENVDVSGTIFVDVGTSIAELRNVKADNMEVYSANSNIGVKLFGVQLDEIHSNSELPLAMSIYSADYPTQIYRTNLDLKNKVRLVNYSFDSNVSFGRVEVTKDSIEGNTLYVDGNVIKDREYLEVYKGCTIGTLGSNTRIQQMVLRQEDMGTVSLIGSSPTTTNFGDVFIEEKGALNISGTVVSKVVMKENHVNLDLTSGEIGMLVTNNNDVIMDDYTKQNIANIVIKDPDDPEDITAPEVKAEAQTVYNTPNNDGFAVIAEVQSNELSGYVYIVKTGELQDTYKEIEALREDKKAARTLVTSMNEDMEISALGLEPGTYYAYAIDAAKNISTRGENAIEVIGLEKTNVVTLDDTPRQGDVTISGTAEPNATISMQISTNAPIQTLAGADGAFAFTNISITQGQVLKFSAKHPDKLTSDDLSVTVLQSLKLGNNIKSFIFRSASNGAISDEFGDVVGIINETVTPAEITMNIPNGTISSNFVAEFSVDDGATPMINGTAMSSGIKPNISYQGISIDVKAENGNTKQYKIILNELSNQTDITSTVDYKITDNSVESGNDNRLDSNLSADEFDSNIVYPTSSKHLILLTLGDNFDKTKFDQIYNNQSDPTNQANIISGTEKLQNDAKLVVKAEDGTIKTYKLVVIEPKLIVNETSKDIKQDGTLLNAGVHQEYYYKVDLGNDPKKGTVNLTTDKGSVELTINDLSPSSILKAIEGALEANKVLLGLENFEITVEGTQLKLKHTGENLEGDFKNKPEVNRPNLLTIEEIDENDLYKDIKITKEAGRTQRTEYLLNYEIAEGSSGAKIEIIDDKGRSVADYPHNSTAPMTKVDLANNIDLVDTKAWDLLVNSNTMTFVSKVYDSDKALSMTVTNAVYDQDDDDFKKVNDNNVDIEGQKYIYNVDFSGFDKPMTYSFDIVEYDNSQDNPYSYVNNNYELYVESASDFVSKIQGLIGKNNLLWNAANLSDEKLKLEAKRGIIEISNDRVIGPYNKEDVNIQLTKQSNSIDGVAYTKSKPIIAVVDFGMTNIAYGNNLSLEISASNEDNTNQYSTSTSVTINKPVAPNTIQKSDVVNAFAADADYTGKDFEVITREELKALVGEDSNIYKTTTTEQLIIVKQEPHDSMTDLNADIISAK